MQHPRDKPLRGAKYIKYHNLKCSLKSIKGNRDLNAVVTFDVTVELGKAFHSSNNLSLKKILRTNVLQKGANTQHVLPCIRERLE